jgi:release factor glutamine methyltransferase
MLALKPKPILIQQALRDAVLALQTAKIESASLDARVLLQHVLRVSREQLLLCMDEAMTAPQQAQYRELIGRRVRRQPVAQLIGKREFFGRAFKVTEHTLDPRPDSETLIEAVLERKNDQNAPLRILDLGTGTGCLLLTLLAEYPQSSGVGVDISEDALAIAKENAMALGVQSRVRFISSRWFEAAEGRFDIVISNPPYIATHAIEALSPEVAQFEPRLALDGGADGLDAYRAILPRMQDAMREDALAVLEIGMGQQQDVEAIGQASGLVISGIKQDLAGIPRAIIMTLT